MTASDAAALGTNEFIGKSFFDNRTGLRYAALHPVTHQRLWTTSVELAVARYAEFNVDAVIDADLRSGYNIDIFWLAFDGDRPVAGARALRVQKLDGLRAVAQMAGHPRERQLRELLAAKIADGGLIEGGTAWRAPDAPRGTTSVLARCCLASTYLLGHRWCVGTAGAPGLKMWTEAGCEPADYGSGMPWPSPEHETRLLLFDSERLAPALAQEYKALMRALNTACFIAVTDTHDESE